MYQKEKNKYNLSNSHEGIKRKIEFKEFQLSNGLHIILSKNNKIPSAAVNIAYHVGAKDEDIDKTGLAHLFEHLLFEGTANTSKGQFDELLTMRGGDSNAYTNWDITSYFMVVPSNQLEFALWLDSDRLAGFGIDEESMEIQKDVVLEEKLTMCDNTPYGSLEEEISKRLFVNSGYAHPIIGDMEQLKKLKLSDLHSFYKNYYIPNNAVLAISGDIDYDDAERLVRKYYEDIPAGILPERKEFKEAEDSKNSEEIIYDNVNIPAKFIYYKAPKIGTRDFYVLKVLDFILSEGDSSKLHKKLVVDNTLVSEIESSIIGMEHCGMFYISALINFDSNINEVQSLIDEELSLILNGNLSDEDIRKAKNKIETSYSFKYSSIISTAERLCASKLLLGNADRINSELEEMLSVTKEEITSAANKYLTSDKRVILNYLPKENK